MDRDGWKTARQFDWRYVNKKIQTDPINVNGNGNNKEQIVSGFVVDVTDQGDCGCCFAVATTGMLTGRYWIRNPTSKPDFKLDKTKYSSGLSNEGTDWDRFSVHELIDSSDVNQGCNGGDPALSAMWLQEFPGVTVNCWKIMREIPDDELRLRAQETIPECKHQLQVTDFHYLAGSVGACGVSFVCEQLLQRELWQNGPVSLAVDMGPTSSSGGIHTIDDDVTLRVARESRLDTDEPERFSWQRVEHAVLLTGWGEDNKMACRPRLHVSDSEEKECTDLTDVNACGKIKHCRWSGNTFWTIQNSWGAHWGEHGYGKYGPRGHDTLFVEFGAFITAIKRVDQKIQFTNDPLKDEL